ncbi:MAG: serine protease [Candidatus Abyssobacteria bacterium SURF_17]|uniref:Serine protease n=1 Tax=Candidatus Abyssobacteria bacterium SURF_17 TaxID=2093361 RepID=A0A419EXC3_9BACT|nr:MAG: serine protease [Candidatus Abyssubacteria bacterium SURF_17]
MGERNREMRTLLISPILLAVGLLFFSKPIVAEEESLYSQLNKAVIRLEHSEQILLEGADNVYGLGTAFFVHSAGQLFVVTAGHIPKDAMKNHYDMHARVQVKNEKTGNNEVISLKLPTSRWLHHPQEDVDVAAMRLGKIVERKPTAFRYEPQTSHESSENQLPYVDTEPPTSILVFGFPLDLGFKLSEQRPLGRLGIVAMQTGKKFLKIDDKFTDERAYLIDARIFPGNSGSPIINHSRPLLDPGIELLGIVIATNSALDFAVAEPTSRIRETLDAAKNQDIRGFDCWYHLDPISQ